MIDVSIVCEYAATQEQPASTTLPLAGPHSGSRGVAPCGQPDAAEPSTKQGSGRLGGTKP